MFGSSGRSSKTSKCKTQLKLVVSRIKLLRNKREIRVKHLRRDVAELLRSKQDANARTRAEYAIREQNMMDAFDLIEHYCDFLAGRIQSISGQKECPPELKEAIASLIYAAPRCADLPELLEVRSIFSAKFGKHFIATIVELRVGCGVSRKMIEKFSTQPVSTELKMTLMAEVAKEFGVEWKPEDLAPPEEKRPQPPPVSGASQSQEKKSQNGSPKSPLDETPPASAKPRVVASSGAASDHELEDSNDEEEEVPSPVPSAKPVQHVRKNTHVPVARPVEPHSPAAQQFIPFIAQSKVTPSPPDPYGQFSRGIMNPYAPQVPQQAAVKSPEARDPYMEYKKKLIMNHSYVDVATAAEAAAQSADQAAVAARAAANMAHKQLSRESSMADDVVTSVASARAVRNVDARRSGVVKLEERVASYVQAHANDTDSSEWEASPLPNDLHRLNTGRNLFAEQKAEKREEVSRAAEQEDERGSFTENYRRQEHRASTIRRNNHVASTEIFHASENIQQHHDVGRPVFDDYKPSSKLGHQREEFEDLFNRKARLSEARFDDYRSTTRLSYNGRRREEDEGVFNTGPEISKRQEPETSYDDRFEKPVVFDEAPPSFSRLDSFTTNMESMHVNFLSRTEKLFEKEDSDNSPVESRRRRTRDKPASKLPTGDLEWQTSQDHEEPSSFGKKTYEPDLREDQHEAGTGRNAATQNNPASDWRSRPPSRSPPKVPEGKHLNSQQQFHGSGVDYRETSSLASQARRYRFAGASVRTKKT